MARIRCVKPEFWTSEQVISCSQLARLAFIGLWSFCDDNGVHAASYVRLKAEVFPGDSISIDEIKHLISELINNNLLREYSVDEKSYWIVTGWKQHQRIDKPTYKYPLPQSSLRKLDDHSTNSLGNLADNSTSSRRLVDKSSPPDRNGMERNGKEDNICQVAVATSPHDVIQEIFLYWQTILNHPRAILDLKRKSKISQALKLGYSVGDLRQAIDGCAHTPFNMGQNERNQKYDDIDLIFRDASHIDRFIGNAINPPTESNNRQPQNNIMQGVI